MAWPATPTSSSRSGRVLPLLWASLLIGACQPDYESVEALPASSYALRDRHRGGAPHTLVLQREMRYRGLWVQRELALHANGRIERALLARTQDVGGHAARAGSAVTLYAGGQLRSLFLARKEIVGGQSFAANTFLRFSRKGRLVGAMQPARKHGVLFDEGGRELACAPDGVILVGARQGWGCKLARDATIAGLPCKAGHRVSFDVDGHLHLAVLARAHTFAGKVVPPASWVELDAGGALRRSGPAR